MSGFSLKRRIFMRISLLVLCLTIACTGSALEPGTKGSANGVASNLIARHAEVAEVPVSSVEGKPVEGTLLMKPMLKGEQMTLLELHYQAGTKAPIHIHAHESLIYVVSGKVKTSIGDAVYILGPGDAARHPKGVPHAVEALVDSTIIEVKSPAPDITRFLGTAPAH
jgi:quercetin dioxygenase-like cupin family protein